MTFELPEKLFSNAKKLIRLSNLKSMGEVVRIALDDLDNSSLPQATGKSKQISVRIFKKQRDQLKILSKKHDVSNGLILRIALQNFVSDSVEKGSTNNSKKSTPKKKIVAKKSTPKKKIVAKKSTPKKKIAAKKSTPKKKIVAKKKSSTKK